MNAKKALAFINDVPKDRIQHSLWLTVLLNLQIFKRAFIRKLNKFGHLSGNTSLIWKVDDIKYLALEETLMVLQMAFMENLWT